MSQKWIQLRRAVVALGFVGSLGFGATQALAAPEQARRATCSRLSGPTFDTSCEIECKSRGYDWGYCNSGYCVCRNFTVGS